MNYKYKIKNSKKVNSEFRQDPVSGDWILTAFKRSQRPAAFLKKSPRQREPLKKCPFEKSLLRSRKSFLVYQGKDDWEVVVVENKFPALTPHFNCPHLQEEGLYSKVDGVGYHDLIITRHHHHNFAHLSFEQAKQVMKVFRERYLMLAKDKCVAYISIFQNWGREAGATVYHPHYQLMALPIIPPAIKHSLMNARRYFRRHRQCIDCSIIDYEKKEKKRIVFENTGAIVLAPYASRTPFELRIYPKKHLPYFEETSDKDLALITKALHFSLQQIEKKLNDADYNFFIHTAPLKNKKSYRYYHWHIEILPKLRISAGFELSTGIEINIVDPDQAAKILRK